MRSVVTFFFGGLLSLAPPALAKDSNWLGHYYECFGQMFWYQKADEPLIQQAAENIQQAIAQYPDQFPEQRYASIIDFFGKAKTIWVHFENKTVMIFFSEREVIPVVLSKDTIDEGVQAKRYLSSYDVEGDHHIILYYDQPAIYPPIFLSAQLKRNWQTLGLRVGRITQISIGGPFPEVPLTNFVSLTPADIPTPTLRAMMQDALVESILSVKKEKPLPQATQVGMGEGYPFRYSEEQTTQALAACRGLITSNTDLKVIMALDSVLTKNKEVPEPPAPPQPQ